MIEGRDRDMKTAAMNARCAGVGPSACVVASSPMDQALAYLNSSIDRLEKELIMLRERAAPIRVNAPENGANTALRSVERPPVSGSSSVVMVIHDQANRVENLTHAAATLRDSLEV